MKTINTMRQPHALLASCSMAVKTPARRFGAKAPRSRPRLHDISAERALRRPDRRARQRPPTPTLVADDGWFSASRKGRPGTAGRAATNSRKRRAGA
jgi:hypothetical protein